MSNSNYLLGVLSFCLFVQALIITPLPSWSSALAPKPTCNIAEFTSPTPPIHSFQKLVICPTHKPNLPVLQKFFLPYYGDMGVPKGYGGEASRKKLYLNKGLTFPTKDPLLHSQ